MPLSVVVYFVAVTFKMTEQVKQWICIQFCIKLPWKLQMIQKATAMGNWWLAASLWQCPISCVISCTEFFGKTSNHPGDSVPSEPTFGSLWLLTFPKTKITFDREEISLCQWDSGKYDGTADGDWENCVRSQCAYFEGAEVSLSYVQCFLYLVSSSINVSIFHTAWLDTFWTELYTSRKEEGCFPRGQLLFSVWSSDAPFYIFPWKDLDRQWTSTSYLWLWQSTYKRGRESIHNSIIMLH